MSRQEPSITAADTGEKQQVIDTLTLAFTTSPLVRWFFSKPSIYLERFPAFVDAYGGKSFEQDSAFYVGDVDGVALWLPPDVEPDEQALAELLTETLQEKKHPPAWSLAEQLDAAHPDQPHWVLTHLGVDPTGQGIRLGTARARTGTV